MRIVNAWMGLILIIVGCESKESHYKDYAVPKQFPKVLVNYELSGDVVAVEQSYLNNYSDTALLEKFDTETYSFKNGFLKSWKRDGMSGGRYEIKQTSSRWKDSIPISYSTTRNGGRFEDTAITYDAAGRPVKEYTGYFITTYSYDGDKLTEKLDIPASSEEYRNRWVYEYGASGQVTKQTLYIRNKSGVVVKSSHKIFANRGIEKDVTFTNDTEEVYATNELNESGHITYSKNKYDKEQTKDYIYDDRGNWMVCFHTTNGTLYVRQRVITYKDGMVTGRKYMDAGELALLKDLKFNKKSYKKRMSELATIRLKNKV